MIEPTLSMTWEFSRIDGERADIAPVDGQRAAAGGEQAPRVAHVEVDLVGRPVLGRLDVNVEGGGEGIVVDQRLHGVGIEEDALRRPLRRVRVSYGSDGFGLVH